MERYHKLKTLKVFIHLKIYLDYIYFGHAELFNAIMIIFYVYYVNNVNVLVIHVRKIK